MENSCKPFYVTYDMPDQNGQMKEISDVLTLAEIISLIWRLGSRGNIKIETETMEEATLIQNLAKSALNRK